MFVLGLTEYSFSVIRKIKKGQPISWIEKQHLRKIFLRIKAETNNPLINLINEVIW